ncbi:MAG: 3-deoxy-D-manno-octulosonic acid transferase [Methylococcaceae bacterium]|nr:3-deoxy-D-manno-octulosonic acid transferase [Methylococcaceae bacterium]
MRLFYSLLFYGLLPFILLRLGWRGIKAPAYRLRWRERLGFYPQSPLKDVIWIHAVSVGEAEAVFPLLKQLQQAHPSQHFLVTTTTPTGSARVTAVMGDSVSHVYLPYDTFGAVRRFFTHFQPKVAIILETEIWPNLFAACGQRHIPLVIINACLSEKSARGYQKIPYLVQSTLANITLIAAQTEADAQRFLAIGATAKQIQVYGNIKFDSPPQDGAIAEGRQLRKQIFSERFVWIIASTHQEEEAYFLALYAQCKVIAPDLLLLIVPRHPERFHEVQQLCLKSALKVVMRTAATSCDSATDVYIADTLGELKMLYAAADIAFVGGSLVPIGGHNVIEPAAVNVPIMFGPYMDNVRLIADGLLKANAAVQCADIPALLSSFKHLYVDAAYRQTLAQNAQHFVKQNQGAITRILALLQPIIRR